jgi:hypothetical protein
MSNHYKRKAKKEKLKGGLSGTADQTAMKESLVDTAKNTPIDIGAAIGGGFVGSAIGKPSLVTGAVVSGLSHFFKNKLGDSLSRIGSSFGVGIMAGGFAKSSEAVSGTDDKKTKGDAAKERMKSYGEDLKQRLYLDKLPSTKKADSKKGDEKKTDEKKATTEKDETKPVNGTENFYYPETEPRLKSDVDLSALEDFQEELQESANHHRERRKKEQRKDSEGIEGIDDMNPEDHNY